MKIFFILFLFQIVIFPLITCDRTFAWLSNNAGLFSQFLQMKIMIAIAKQFNRTAIVPDISTAHFKDFKFSICDILSLPTNVRCNQNGTQLSELKDCMATIEAEKMRSTSELTCYKGTLPLMGKKSVREAIVLSANLAPRLSFQPRIYELASKYMASVGISKGDSFTVVHWRRGDQLLTRCNQGKDTSVNCGTARQLIAKIRNFTDDRMVFIATNEHVDSVHLTELRSAGFKLFRDGDATGMGEIECFLVEVVMMIEASTFLGWGVSEVNDVVEYERMKFSKSNCIAVRRDGKEASVTWCELYLAALAIGVNIEERERSAFNQYFMPKAKANAKYRTKAKVNLTIPAAVDVSKASMVGTFYVSKGSSAPTPAPVTGASSPVKLRAPPGLVIDFALPQNYSTTRLHSNKTIIWISNSEGLFSQFIQLKIKLSLSQQYGRQTIISGIDSPHSNRSRWNLCDVLKLPPDVQCMLDVPAELCQGSSLRTLDQAVVSGIEQDVVCYEGPMPLLGTHSRREANLIAMYLPVSLSYMPYYQAMFQRFKRDLGIKEGASYTVAHWRRGDQLVFRCKSSFRARRDKSVNCGSADELRRSISRLTNHSIVYVATNERTDSAHFAHLRAVGYLTFQDTHSPEFASLSPMEVFLLEAALMMDATTFLSWGISEINDIVEYERMKANKTWCTAKDDGPAQDAITWCDVEISVDQISVFVNDTTSGGEVFSKNSTAGKFAKASYNSQGRRFYSNANETEMQLMYAHITHMYDLNKSIIRRQSRNKSESYQDSLRPYTPKLFDHTKEYNISFSKSKELLWLNDEDGLFSQYLQLKLKYQVAQKFGRVLVIPPIVSHHFNYTPIVICSIFDLPSSIRCLDREPQHAGYHIKGCNVKILDEVTLLSSRNICYSGLLPLFGTVGRKEAVLLSLVTSIFPMKFSSTFTPLIRRAKEAMEIIAAGTGSRRRTYTAVHWRRGDQLSTRCIANRDKSVNCGTSKDLVALVQAQSSNDFVYIATNEAKDSTELQILRMQGFRAFEDTLLGEVTILEQFIVEMVLMLEATTFLGFGLSEVNDIVDYERNKAGRSWCVTKEPWTHSYSTYCSRNQLKLSDEEEGEAVAVVESLVYLEEGELAKLELLPSPLAA